MGSTPFSRSMRRWRRRRERAATPSWWDELRLRGSVCGRGANVMLGEEVLERGGGMTVSELERMRMLGHGLGLVLEAAEVAEDVLWLLLVSSEGALREEEPALVLDSSEPDERPVSETIAATIAVKGEESGALLAGVWLSSMVVVRDVGPWCAL